MKRAPLDAQEQHAAYLFQVHVGAVKRCDSCERVKRVADFPRYGDPLCWRCYTLTPRARLMLDVERIPA